MRIVFILTIVTSINCIAPKRKTVKYKFAIICWFKFQCIPFSYHQIVLRRMHTWYAKCVEYFSHATLNSRVTLTENKAGLCIHKGDFFIEKMQEPPGNKKRVTEDRETERGEVWTSNGTGGMTNQLLVVQLGPHTLHRYYRDHYLSPATPLPRQKGEGTTQVAWCTLTNSLYGFSVASLLDES